MLKSLINACQACQRFLKAIQIPVFNRPGVAGAVLQTPPSLIKSLIHGLWKYIQGIVNPKP